MEGSLTIGRAARCGVFSNCAEPPSALSILPPVLSGFGYSHVFDVWLNPRNDQHSIWYRIIEQMSMLSLWKHVGFMFRYPKKKHTPTNHVGFLWQRVNYLSISSSLSVITIIGYQVL
jgi:hypothetical protein